MSTQVAPTAAARPAAGMSRWAKIAIGVGIGLIVLAGLALAIFVGRSEPEGLEVRYGRHRTPGFPASVNGTDVLAGMFGEAGHTIYYRSRIISSEMEGANTIVWFPNDYAAPSEELCVWFDDWLATEPGRTLIYVGRDFNAAPQYWLFMLQKQNAKELTKVETAKSKPAQESQAEQDKPAEEDKPAKKDESKEKASKQEADKKETGKKKSARGDAIDDVSKAEDLTEEARTCEWFTYEPEPIERMKSLSGPWSKGIDSAKADVSLGTRMHPDGASENLLDGGEDESLVTRLEWPYWEGSQVFLVANGSFLLNVPLVNHENRKLAGKLIEATGEPGRVVFLESGPGGPPIDPPYDEGSLWTVFGAWPLNAILLQLAAVGVIFCFARWPIFGRPQQPPAEVTADFSKHVAAVGQLLSRTRDRSILESAVTAEGPRVAAEPQKIALGPSGQPLAGAPPMETKGN